MNSYITAIVIVAVIIALYLKYRSDLASSMKKYEKKLRVDFGKKTDRHIFTREEYEVISHYFKNRSKNTENISGVKTAGIIDDMTWNDLDMDKVYASMNYCSCQMGDEYLYDLLHRPLGDAEALKERGRVIKWFDENEDERTACQMAFSQMGRTGKYSFTDHLLKLDEIKEESNILHYFCILLGVIAIAMIFINPPLGFALILAVTAFNVATYFKRKGETDRYVVCFSYIVWTLRSVENLIKNDYEAVSSYISAIRDSYNKLKSLERGMFLLRSGRGLTGSIAELPLDYLRIFFHLDQIRFNQMLSKVKLNRNEIFKLEENLGFLDAMISIAHYRRTLKHYCEPEFLIGEPQRFIGKSLIHPLIERHVPSDINTDKGILVTGSNASGKSTFLRTTALAVLLSETIYTAAAEKCSFSPCRIYSSMSVEDDLIKGESFYMAEIRGMKRILDAVRSENEFPIMCFTDELLKGTNTVERVAAGAQILKSLANSRCLLFAATHDIELTYMLEKYMDNCHFSEIASDGEISFDYILRKGRAESRDAIKLLEMMGYEADITEAAFDTAETFVKTGEWPEI